MRKFPMFSIKSVMNSLFSVSVLASLMAASAANAAPIKSGVYYQCVRSSVGSLVFPAKDTKYGVAASIVITDKNGVVIFSRYASADADLPKRINDVIGPKGHYVSNCLLIRIGPKKK